MWGWGERIWAVHVLITQVLEKFSRQREVTKKGPFGERVPSLPQRGPGCHMQPLSFNHQLCLLLAARHSCWSLHLLPRWLGALSSPALGDDGFLGCQAVVTVVKEAVESRLGCCLCCGCCAANPPLGPWCVRGRGLWKRQCPVGSAAVGHCCILAEGTNEEEKREVDFTVLCLGGEREGMMEKG